MIISDHVLQNIRAVAEFREQCEENYKKYCVLEDFSRGELLDNGNFIFSYEGDGKRKMVLTRNNGEHLESGYMKKTSVDELNWKNPANWMGKSKNYYSIDTFEGTKGILLSL